MEKNYTRALWVKRKEQMVDLLFIVFNVIAFILTVASLYIKSDKISATLAIIAIIPAATAFVLMLINIVLGG